MTDFEKAEKVLRCLRIMRDEYRKEGNFKLANSTNDIIQNAEQSQLLKLHDLLTAEQDSEMMRLLRMADSALEYLPPDVQMASPEEIKTFLRGKGYEV